MIEGKFVTQHGVELWACPTHGKDFMTLDCKCAICGFAQTDGERAHQARVAIAMQRIAEDEAKRKPQS